MIDRAWLALAGLGGVLTVCGYGYVAICPGLAKVGCEESFLPYLQQRLGDILTFGLLLTFLDFALRSTSLQARLAYAAGLGLACSAIAFVENVAWGWIVAPAGLFVAQTLSNWWVSRLMDWPLSIINRSVASKPSSLTGHPRAIVVISLTVGIVGLLAAALLAARLPALNGPPIQLWLAGAGLMVSAVAQSPDIRRLRTVIELAALDSGR
jgi:hypothetical protein